MRDISSSNDIHLLVNHFYSKIRQDDLLQPYFEHLNWSEHLPRMEKFWRFALLDESGYITNVTEIHLSMKLNKSLFDRWIELFNATVDENFKGENAEKAKFKAYHMGWTMQAKFKD